MALRWLHATPIYQIQSLFLEPMKKDVTFALVVWLHYSPAFWADGKSKRIDLLFFFHDTWNARHILL
jgi:hypothetical protein